MPTESPEQQRAATSAPANKDAAAKIDARDTPDEGRSAERARQDEVIEKTASKESWIAQLLRALKLSGGRPSSGGRDRNG